MAKAKKRIDWDAASEVMLSACTTTKDLCLAEWLEAIHWRVQTAPDLNLDALHEGQDIAPDEIFPAIADVTDDECDIALAYLPAYPSDIQQLVKQAIGAVRRGTRDMRGRRENPVDLLNGNSTDPLVYGLALAQKARDGVGDLLMRAADVARGQDAITGIPDPPPIFPDGQWRAGDIADTAREYNRAVFDGKMRLLFPSNETVTLDGETFRLPGTIVSALKTLAATPGQYMPGCKLGATGFQKPKRDFYSKLPPAIAELVESAPSRGYRLNV